MELRVLQLINQGRAGIGKGAEVMHGGVRVKARAHSVYQSSIGFLTHDGVTTRINGATPDPAESNNAPDDGFRSYCENVAYFYPGAGATDEQVAQKLYSLWYNSPGHRDCMFDSYGYGFNAAGVGIYRDAAGYWWATFESVKDVSPPSAWTRVQQNSTAAKYSGTWSTQSSGSATGGSYAWSATKGAYAKYAFTGTGVRWIGIRSPNGGIAEVRIDGALVAKVNQYAGTTSWKQTMFEKTGLVAGSHTIEVRVTGTRDSRAANVRAYVDAFERRS
jgi:hypothetical protein